MTTRKCKCCECNKELSEFSPQKSDNPFILNSCCDECLNNYKWCNGCSLFVELNKFVVSRVGKRHSKCKTCEKRRSRKNNRVGDKFRRLCRKQEHPVLCFEYLGGKCSNPNCPLPDRDWPSSIYEFHHRDPAEKSFTIAGKYDKSWSSLKKELDKCDLLCVLCHRMIHIDAR